MSSASQPAPVMVQGPAGMIAMRAYRAEGSVLAPLLCIHPVNTGGAVWDALARRLCAQRTVLVPDLRGHGGSTQNGPYTAMDYAADVLAVLDHFGIAQAHLAGGSIGGPVSVLLAATAPQRVRSMTSYGGALTLSIDDATLAHVRGVLEREGTNGLLRQLMPNALAPARRSAALIDAAIGIAGGRSPEVVYAIIEAAFATDVSAHAARCRAPALIVNGEDDTTCTVADGRRMAEALGGKAVALEGVGHLPMLEVPDLAASLLSEHMARHDTHTH